MSGREIDFYLYLIKRQSDTGYVEDISHRQMQQDIGMPRSTFHVVINNLEKMGMIDVNWDNRNKYFNIFVVDNSFLSKSDYKEGYVNINLDFILSEEFVAMNCNLKKFFIRLLGLKADAIQVKLLKDTLKLYKVNKFMDALKLLFDMVISEDAITFAIKQHLLKRSCSGEYLYYENKIESYCENYNLDYTEDELRDTTKSIINHIRRGRFALVQKALDAIRRIGRLQPKLVNHICKVSY